MMWCAKSAAERSPQSPEARFPATQASAELQPKQRSQTRLVSPWISQAICTSQIRLIVAYERFRTTARSPRPLALGRRDLRVMGAVQPRLNSTVPRDLPSTAEEISTSRTPAIRSSERYRSRRRSDQRFSVTNKGAPFGAPSYFPDHSFNGSSSLRHLRSWQGRCWPQSCRLRRGIRHSALLRLQTFFGNEHS